MTLAQGANVGIFVRSFDKPYRCKSCLLLARLGFKLGRITIESLNFRRFLL